MELPNTHGMAIFADGGVMASKPYAASGAYINRMSDYCGGYAHDVKVKIGPGACPFNILYWSFLIENEDKLARNPRMAMPYRNLSRMSDELRAEYKTQGRAFWMGWTNEAPARRALSSSHANLPTQGACATADAKDNPD